MTSKGTNFFFISEWKPFLLNSIISCRITYNAVLQATVIVYTVSSNILTVYRSLTLVSQTHDS